MTYKAKNNEIIEIETGKQIAVVMPANCTRRESNMMAAFAAQQMNYEARRKQLVIHADTRET